MSVKQQLKMLWAVYNAVPKVLAKRKGYAGRASVLEDGSFVSDIQSVEEAVKVIEEAINLTPYKAGEDINIIIDMNNNNPESYQGGKYEVEKGKLVAVSEFVSSLVKLRQGHPAVSAFVNPLHLLDGEGWSRLGESLNTDLKDVDIFVDDIVSNFEEKEKERIERERTEKEKQDKERVEREAAEAVAAAAAAQAAADAQAAQTAAQAVPNKKGVLAPAAAAVANKDKEAKGGKLTAKGAPNTLAGNSSQANLLNKPNADEFANVKRIYHGVVMKLTQMPTVSQGITNLQIVAGSNVKRMLTAKPGETADTLIADLAVASGVEYFRCGGLSRAERIAKYNRLVNIEEYLTEHLMFESK